MLTSVPSQLLRTCSCLLKPGGVPVDNVLWDGRVADLSINDWIPMESDISIN